MVLDSLQGILGIDASTGGVLGLVEGATEAGENLRILPVLLVVGLDLLVEIGGFATDNLLDGINVGRCAGLCLCCGAEYSHEGSDKQIFHCFHLDMYFNHCNFH